MTTISIVADSRSRLADLYATMSGEVAADYLRIDDLAHSKPNDAAIVDIDLGKCNEVLAVKAWLSNRPQSGTVILCVDDASSHLQLTQARAIGATAIVQRPLNATRLREILLGLDQSSVPSPAAANDDASQDLTAIQGIFEAALAGESPSMDSAARAGARIVNRLHDIGLANYLDAIRNHHSRTYTHCLTVTAVAATFGILLGFGRKDTERLAVAGLLHDIGKSQIPLSILEKPVALDEHENAIMQMHVTLGYDMLRGMQGLPDDTLDLVLHHHEYLDGSGYPHGLRDTQISDLTRMMTIADVYGALIEPRSYKPPMSGLQALEVLRGMDSKLDGTLVRVFAPLAHSLAA
jgi:putative nucleotidyltransferase with HDIG domain